MAGVIRRWRRGAVKPLRGVIDVYQCQRCGTTLAVNADAETFRSPAPLECKCCPGEPDMRAGRYYAVPVASSVER